MLKICMILAPRPSSQATSIFAEACRFLAESGAAVDIVIPEEITLNSSDIKADHDLYILKSKSELAFCMAGALHAAGANILNPYSVARMIRNKAVAARVLREAGVPVPDSYIAANPQMMSPLLAAGPLIVKPNMGSRGRGVRLVRDAQALEGISTSMQMVFAQRYLEPEGNDHKMYVIGGEVFGVKRVWPAETYAEKLGEPILITPDVREIALKCGRAFGIELFGFDIIWSAGKPYVVDISSFPGFKGVPDAGRRIADYIYTVGGRILNKEPMLPGA